MSTVPTFTFDEIKEADEKIKAQNDRVYELLLKEEEGLAQLFFESNKEKLVYHNEDYYMFDNVVKIWIKKSSRVMGLEMCLFLEPIIKDHIKKWIPTTKEDNTVSEPQKNPFPIILKKYIQKNFGTKAMVEKLTPLIEKSQERQDEKDFIFNQDFHHLIPIKGGLVVDLKSGELEDGKPEYKFDFYLNLEIEQDMNKIKFIDEIVLNICCGDKKLFNYLQVMLGYMITGETKEQRVFIWYGSGRNGKSTIISLLKKVLGKLYGDLPEYLILNKESNRFKDDDSASPSVVKLKDSRVAVLSETKKAEEINDRVVKRITGGEDLGGRGLFKGKISFKPKFKPVICSNFKPKVNIEDYALMRRIVLFPFNAKFVEKPVHKNEYPVDKDLTSKLEKDYLNAFFTWLCMGAKKYYKSGYPDTNDIEILKIELETFKNENQCDDDIQDWLGEYCDLTNNEKDETKGSDLFKSYRDWYMNSRPDRNHKKDKEFYKILRQKNIKTISKHSATWFSGIKIIKLYY